MARSLKEALLDQFALLQERGLAPSEMPREDEAPMIVVESAPRGRSTRVRRESLERFNEREEFGQYDVDRDRPRGPRRDSRLEEGERRRPLARGGAAARGRPRTARDEPELVAPSFGPRPPMGGGRPMGPRPPLGSRPDRPGFGAPRSGVPGRPMVGRTDMLQQRAEQRRREEDEITDMRRLLGEISGEEIDDAYMERFSQALTEETGALPPPGIVVSILKDVRSADPRIIGDGVRAFFRRRRAPARPAGGAGGPRSSSSTPAAAPPPEAPAPAEPELVAAGS